MVTQLDETSYLYLNNLLLRNRLNSRLLILLTVQQEMEIYDPFTKKKMQVIKTGDMDLVYHTRFSPMLGGYITNPPKKRCFSGSTSSFKKGIFFLGMKTIYFLHFLNWKEQIQAILPTNAPTTLPSKRQSGSWIAALLLAEEFYKVKKNLKFQKLNLTVLISCFVSLDRRIFG